MIKLFFFQVLIILTFWIAVAAPVNAQKKPKNTCIRWQARIDQTLGEMPTYDRPEELTEKETLIFIECLLQLEGNRNKASFGGAVRTDASSVPQFTPVEVAALYYISYLFYQKFDHSNASVVALADDSGEFSSKNSVKKAYKSYRKWFKKVKRMGLNQARQQKLDPLSGSGVAWY